MEYQKDKQVIVICDDCMGYGRTIRIGDKSTHVHCDSCNGTGKLTMIVKYEQYSENHLDRLMPKI